MITRSFDDPSAEVRNATARALYDLASDRAASFTRALREASPDRRRKIGAAIAGSGLARDAISALSGESRDTTQHAFSILFLMAKAGEVQPLMHSIKEHSDLQVRLALTKLLALSNQPQSLPGLRGLVMRGSHSLPPEVHAAVMEAIYSLSSGDRDNASAVL
jgi:HEAT repeat protein